MKRTRDKIETCAICRSGLSEKCIDCDMSGEKDRICQGWVSGAACGHPFHVECISRWILQRNCCPLCNGSWVFPWNLSLKQLVAVKSIDDEQALVEYVAAGDALDSSIFVALDNHLRTFHSAKKKLPSIKQRLLARTFGRYLTLDELKTLVDRKTVYEFVERKNRERFAEAEKHKAPAS